MAGQARVRELFGASHGLLQADMVARLALEAGTRTHATADTENWTAWALWPNGVVTYRFDTGVAPCAKSAWWQSRSRRT